MKIKIYIVCHNLFENTNAFFMLQEEAVQYLSDQSNSTQTPIEQWRIKEINEGEQFWADIYH